MEGVLQGHWVIMGPLVLQERKKVAMSHGVNEVISASQQLIRWPRDPGLELEP
jgi:hypothetical protein